MDDGIIRTINNKAKQTTTVYILKWHTVWRRAHLGTNTLIWLWYVAADNKKICARKGFALYTQNPLNNKEKQTCIWKSNSNIRWLHIWICIYYENKSLSSMYMLSRRVVHAQSLHSFQTCSAMNNNSITFQGLLFLRPRLFQNCGMCILCGTHSMVHDVLKKKQLYYTSNDEFQKC